MNSQVRSKKINIEIPQIVPKTIKIDEAEISYYDEGNSDICILLIHGLSFKVGLVPLITSLRKNVRVVSCDLPGFGLSQKGNFICDTKGYLEFLKKFTDALNLDKYFVFGNSMGGYLSLLMAHSHPDQVVGVIARCPFISYKQLPRYLTNPKLNSRLKSLSQNDLLLKIIVSVLLEKYFSLSSKITKNIVLEEMRKQKISSISLESMKEIVFDMSASDITELIKNIKQPVCLLWGDKDKVLHVSYAKKVATIIPTCDLVIKKGELHTILRVDSELLAKDILDFIYKSKS